jgi:vancomycin resistance protein YoaR
VKRRKRARPLIAVVLGAAVGFLAVVAAWVIDARAHRNAVLPNVALADERVRGMKVVELASEVHGTATRFAEATIVVRTGAGESFQASVPELGVAVDEQRTVDAVLAAGRTGSAPRRLWEWARSFLWPIEIPVAVQVDRKALAKVVAERDKQRVPPVEPNLAVKDGHLAGVPGKDGRGVDPARLADALGRAKPAAGTLVVTMDVTSVPPQYSKADADKLAAEGEKIATAGLQVTAGGQTAAVPPESLRGWLQAFTTGDGLALRLKEDADSVLTGLAELLPEAGVRPTNAGFTVSGGRVSITPSKTGTACCAPEAITAVNEALLDPAKRAAPVELPLKTVEADRTEEDARKLGVVEQVGTFTTPHNSGEPRVQNIHRMADTIRGTVIAPGATFSINGTVGMRTKAKGYVEAPIIGADYKFESDVGGGVSQFATTMFNAAFFAGLDITEYAMHGLYISRYPYGREATLSFPGPDLKVRNSTPYGVLVWPTYTNSSITVTLYSTKYVVSSEQTGQTREEWEATPPKEPLPNTPADAPGPCVRVTTERTRVYNDGRTTVDRFWGLYAPAEGWSCERS